MFHGSSWNRIARHNCCTICKNFSKYKFSDNSAILFVFLKNPLSKNCPVKSWKNPKIFEIFWKFFKNFLGPIVNSVFYTIPHYLQKATNLEKKTAIILLSLFRSVVAASFSSLTNFFVVRRVKRLSSVSTNGNQGSYYATFHFHLTTLAIL